MPSAAPSSYAVSETAEAAPACSLGTLDRMTSAVTVKARPAPTPPTIMATTSMVTPVSAVTTMQVASPSPSATRPPVTAMRTENLRAT